MSRRANGEGSIYKRADGRWAGAITLPNGKRTTLYGKTREDVGNKIIAALKNRQDGLPIANSQATVAVFLRDWLESVKPTLRPTTMRRYRELLELHAIPKIGRVRVSRLSPQHLAVLYADRISIGLSPTTVAQMHRVLHRALGQATRWGLTVRTVATLVDPPRREQRQMQTLSESQVQVFLAAAEANRLSALYVLAVTTGMRQGELLALHWRDVDCDKSLVRVTGTLQRTPDGLRIAEPKTRKSRRQVALSNYAVEALRRHRAKQNEERLGLGSAWDDQDLVFANAVGRPIDPTNLLSQEFRPLLRRAGLPTVRFHDLRHTAATLMLGQGVHPKVVSEMLGHSQISITLDLYSHVTPTMQEQAAAAMDAVFG